MCRGDAAMVIAGKYWAAVLALCGASVVAVAQQAATEAPTGFDTPTLIENPGSQSVSNGIVEPPGDSFALDQQVYETTHDVNSGLGPVFNARACVDCHQNPVTGGASQFTELRVGHTDANGNFVNPTIPIDNGASSIGGRSLLNDRAGGPGAQENSFISYHPHFSNTPHLGTPGGSYWSVVFTFETVEPEKWLDKSLLPTTHTSHAAARCPGAIDALCLMYTTTKYTKEAMFPHTGTWTLNEFVLVGGDATSDILPPPFSQI